MGFAQTLKNINRLRQIITVFAKHGFYEIIAQIGLSRYLGHFEERAAKEEGKRLSAPERVRMALEELGGTFVKLGQILSTRPDLIPREYIEEFSKLQDSVAPLDFETVLSIVKEELKLEPFEVFSNIEEQPLGSASIAQVHKAILKDGTEVVVKVQRPKVERIIETDLSLMFTIADLLERHVRNLAFFRPRDTVAEFARAIREELDFMHEAQNCDRFARAFENDEVLYIPSIHWDFTTKKLLVMDFVDGIKITDVETLRQRGIDTKELARKGADAFFRMVFDHGFFHGDLHGGNILVLNDGRIGLIDFGLVGELSQRLIEEIADIVILLFAQDFEGLAKQYLKLAPGGRRVDVKEFAADLERLIKPLLNRPLKEIDMGRLFLDMAEVALKHKLAVPRDLILLGKTLVALEGIGRTLDPEFDLTGVAQDYAQQLFVERISPDRLMTEAMRLMRDLSELGRQLPAQLGRLMDKLEYDNIGVDLHMPPSAEHGFGKSASARLGYAIICAASTIAGAQLLASQGGLTVWSGLCFGFSALFGVLFLFSLRPRF